MTPTGLAGKAAAPRVDRTWIGGWLVSPSWDLLWILNGIPLALVFLLLGSVTDSGPLLQRIVLVLIALLWGGHNLSPMVAAWGNTDFRTHMLGRRGRFVWFPLALWAAATAVGFLAGSQLTRLPAPDGFAPAAAGPKDHLNGIIALAYVYLVWNQWHFCGQHFGVLAIYRRMQGGAFDPVERAWDRWYCLTFGMVLVPLAWLLNDDSVFRHLSSYLPRRPVSVPFSMRRSGCRFGRARDAVRAGEPQAALSVARLSYVSRSAQLIVAASRRRSSSRSGAQDHWATAIALASRIVANASPPGDRPAPRDWIRALGFIHRPSP